VSANAHRLRIELRAALADGRQLVGTFVKLPSTDVVELAADAGLDFVVIDVEHSTLGSAAVLELVRHSDAIGLAALVRMPDIDAPLINRLLEAGAVGIQLSMLATAAQNRALVAATRFAPVGARSVSLANRAAAFGADGLGAFLAAEVDAPPILVGQIETAVDEPWAEVVGGLDVTFVGTTDLSVSLGLVGDDGAVAAAVATVRAGAVGTAFGGWSGTLARAAAQGLGQAGYLVVGSDIALLRSGLNSLKGPLT
jgi:4-hydroxy-2-oxoheptanedioate aldolase